nr:MAG TPA: hypothetical protein [Caudoviricetes sp.]
MEKASIVIEKGKKSTHVEINGNGAEIIEMLSLAIYDISKNTNIPIKVLIDELYSGALAHKVVKADDEATTFNDVIKELLGE